VRAARFSHVCPLNNDMAVAPDFFRQLQRAFERFPGLFCAAPQVFLPAGVPRQETGKMVIRNAPLPSDFPLRSDRPIAGEDLTYVLYGSSGCSLFDADRLLRLGSFDETYQPAYVEDCDLGVRAWQRGWPSVFAADAHVVHQHRATMNRLYSKERLDYMVAQHWLLFLARTVNDREVFARYWRHGVERLAQGLRSGSDEARRVLREIGLRGDWRARREKAALSDAEIFALCGGSVTVFPGGKADHGGPVVVISADSPCKHVGEGMHALVCYMDEPAPVAPELPENCIEMVTVRRGDSAAFAAALRQTIRKWQPSAR